MYLEKIFNSSSAVAVIKGANEGLRLFISVLCPRIAHKGEVGVVILGVLHTFLSRLSEIEHEVGPHLRDTTIDFDPGTGKEFG